MTEFNRGRELIRKVYGLARNEWGSLFSCLMRVRVLRDESGLLPHRFEVEFWFPLEDPGYCTVNGYTKVLVRDLVIADESISTDELATLVIEDARRQGAG